MSEAAPGAPATDDLLYETEDGVATLTFNRPQARNAMTFEMYDGLAAVCSGIEVGGGVKALILTGAGGRSFAAGTDISLFRGFTEADALAYEEKMDRVLSAVERCPVPTIAAIPGACTGGGAAIAAACDMRIATADLKFGFPIARTLGNCLSIANLARLSAIIGQARVREVIFTARLVRAEEALAIGLVNEVSDDGDALAARARELAGTLAGMAPLTLAATKEGLRRLKDEGPDAPDRDLVTMCYGSEDFRTGLENFLAKRPPEWKGR